MEEMEKQHQEQEKPSSGERFVIKPKEKSHEDLLKKKRELEKKEERTLKKKKMLKFIVSAIVVLVFVELIIVLFLNTNKDETPSTENNTNVSEKKEPVEQKEEIITETPVEETPVEETHPPVMERNFPAVSYYKAENADRYVAYAADKPDLPDEDIVWRVNANLDYKKYEYVVVVNDKNDPYILVNKYQRVPDNYKPDDLVTVDKFIMRQETGDAYAAMRDAALQEGYTLRIVSAYRTVPYQNGLYNDLLKEDNQDSVDSYSERAGYSEHHTGMAIDLFGTREDFDAIVSSPQYNWVKENCYKYGFIIRYPEGAEEITGYEADPCHLRYVGVQVSTDMHEKNIATFEEYHTKYLAG